MNYLEKWYSVSFIYHCGRGLDNLSVALSLGVEEIACFCGEHAKPWGGKQEEKIVCRISSLSGISSNLVEFFCFFEAEALDDFSALKSLQWVENYELCISFSSIQTNYPSNFSHPLEYISV